MNPRPRTRLWVVPITVTALGLVTGCGSDSPTAPSSPTTPATPAMVTSSAAPTAPVMPEAAKAHTKKGAEEFVRFYWEVVNYAQATGDTGPLKAISLPQCDGCNAGIASVESLHNRGGTLTGGSVVPTVVSSELTYSQWGGKQITLGKVVVKTLGSRAEASYPNPSSNAVIRSTKSKYRFEVSAQDSDWQVGQLTALAK